MTFDLEQYRKRVGDWIVSDHQSVRQFKIQDGSIFENYFLTQIYCTASNLPEVAFGLDLQEAAKIEAQLTHALDCITNDSRLPEEARDAMLRYVHWHRSLYRWVIDSHLEKAVAELEAVGAREISATA